MDWAQVRRKARRVVHDTFAISAVYSSPLGVETPCKARMHNELQVHGDLDREGFSQVIENDNRVILDGLVVTPEKHGTILFTDYNVTFEIVNILPDSTDEFRRVEVTLM
jgi:hypothetical protein